MRWVAVVMAVASCGRLKFDPLGDGSLGGDGDGGVTVDARAMLSPPLPVTDTGAAAGCPSLLWTGSEWAVAWQDTRDGLAGEVYFTRLDASGSKLAADLRVTNDVNHTGCPSLAWTGSQYFVAFDDDRFGNYEILGQVIDASGALVGSAIRITNDNSASTQPSVAWNGSDFDLAWVDARGVNYEIHYALLSASGAVMTGPTIVSGTGDYFTCCPNVVETSSGAALVWNDHSSTTDVWLAQVVGGAVKYAKSIGNVDFQPGGLGEVQPALAWSGSELVAAWDVQAPSFTDVFTFHVIDLAGGTAAASPTYTLQAIYPVLAAGPGGYGLTCAPNFFLPLAADGTQTDAVAKLPGTTALALASDGTRYASVQQVSGGGLALVFVML